MISAKDEVMQTIDKNKLNDNGDRLLSKMVSSWSINFRKIYGEIIIKR